ncbi:ribosome maturation factor RimP [Dubosiella muris]|uniref:Ribosome maturation factor RimP n=1 Tax=Dubosiella muris TaxID=3038133 RepID=A0AC61R9D0_9FIRM|nr:ribosome maturation factor RimP [Dubosiella muris]TGY66334.1 ribosome maturation factor RimP [Dubosiella muris]
MDNLRQWIEEALEQYGCRLYELEWLPDEPTAILRVSVEKPGGTVDLDVCTLCSDAISAMLDEKDWNDKEYMLEVCSPGAERELKTYEQIEGALHSYVYVKLKDPKKGIDQVFGDLIEVSPDHIVVAYKVKGRPKKAEIDMENISLIMTAVKL